jgi:hypothetical protein
MYAVECTTRLIMEKTTHVHVQFVCLNSTVHI